MLDSPNKLKLLGIDFGDPFAVDTFSGSSRSIWQELGRRGVLVDAWTPYPGPALKAFYQLLAFRPDVAQWRAAWRRSLPFRNALTRRAKRRLAGSYRGRFNATLQIGAYYDFAEVVDGPKGLLADNNCAITQATNVTFRTSEEIFRKQFNFEERVYRSMDRVFCFSEFLARSMVSDFGCDAEKVRVVGAGINIDEDSIVNPARDWGAKTILFCGFNWNQKGGPVLLEAFSRIRAEEPDARLILVGPSLVEIEKGVVCRGPLSKDDPGELEVITSAFREATVFVLPTLADAFPNVVREAMAAGLPCIASAIGSIPEMIDHGKTGFLVPVNDAQELGDRALDLIRNPELARNMGRAGYERYRQRFTWENTCAIMAEELEALL